MSKLRWNTATLARLRFAGWVLGPDLDGEDWSGPLEGPGNWHEAPPRSSRWGPFLRPSGLASGRAPAICLIRGLPGSGKSTLARGSALSADLWMVEDRRREVIRRGSPLPQPEGTEGIAYRYDPARVVECHQLCIAEAENRLRRRGQITVANTFSQLWELEPYMDIARRRSASVFVADLFDAGLSDEALAARNVHGVPAPAIASMRARWEFL